MNCDRSLESCQCKEDSPPRRDRGKAARSDRDRLGDSSWLNWLSVERLGPRLRGAPYRCAVNGCLVLIRPADIDDIVHG